MNDATNGNLINSTLIKLMSVDQILHHKILIICYLFPLIVSITYTDIDIMCSYYCNNLLFHPFLSLIIINIIDGMFVL